MKPPDLSLVIPVYNEVDNLPVLADEIEAALEGQDRSFEVIWVDDGSTDGSGPALERLCARGNERHRLVRLASNQGQSAALAAGFRRVRGALTVTLDADLQNDPRDIPALLAALEGYDLVSGVRVSRRDTWVRRISSRVANRVRSRVLSDGVTDVGCSLKAYRSEYLRHLPEFKGMHRFLPALVLMQGGRVRELPVNHRPRRFGVAKYGIGNRLWRGLVDLCGVAWLGRRWIDPRLERDFDPTAEVGRP